MSKTLSTEGESLAAEAAAAAAPFELNELRLVRAADQLWLDLRAVNLHAVREGPRWVVRIRSAGQSAQLELGFGPQHVLEHIGGAPSRHIVSAGSRVSFVVLPGQDGFEFSLAGILGAVRGMALATESSAGTANAPFAPTAADFVPAPALARASMAPLMANGARSAITEDAYRIDLALQSIAQGDAPGLLTQGRAAFGAIAPALAAKSAGSTAHGAASAGRATASATAPAAAAAPRAASPGATLAASNALPTSLAISSRLEFTPRAGATRFAHAAAPLTHDGRTDLWQTRLAVTSASGKLIESSSDIIALRSNTSSEAASDAWKADVLSPNLAALSTTNAGEVAALGRDAKPATHPAAKPLRARHLHLTPLGATMDLRGDWPASNTLKSWRHRTAIGRDQVQRTVELGRLYPFGHEAIRTTTTTRVFGGTHNAASARLVIESVITVREPLAPYGTDDEPGRKFPFNTIELLTAETPPGTLDPLLTAPNGDAAFHLVEGSPFRFRCLATDRNNRPLRFEFALVFVPNAFTKFTELRIAYRQRSHLLRLALDEQTITVAPQTPGRPPDSTDLIAAFADLDVAGTGSDFRPVAKSFNGRVPAIERFGAVAAAPLNLSYYNDYLEKAFGDGNPGEMVLQIDGAAPLLGIVDQAANGGLMAALSYPVRGLSRRIGAVAGSLGEVAANRFNPKQWLGDALKDMKLLGVVSLQDLIADVSNTLDDAPSIGQNIVDGVRTQVFRWSAPLFQKDKVITVGGVARIGTLDDRTSQLVIEAVVQPHDNGSMTSRTTCKITNIQLGLGLGPLDLVKVPFEEVSFTSIDGRKPDCNVVMGDITFHDVLAFIGVLASLVDKAGFSDPPALDVTAQGVVSTFSTPFPNVAVGVFSLENISFGARFELFFNGQAPQLSLNFATYDNPFRLTVAMLGGGGYVGLTLSAETGLQRLEGALEFGAALSVNLVVARGSVSAMGGIYFLIEAGEAMLTGYMRIKGQLDVLGLISAAVEMLMALSYDGSVVRGKAEVMVKVSVLFFSKTVRITLERTFAGSNADPTFAELMDPAADEDDAQRPWDEYCLAFA